MFILEDSWIFNFLIASGLYYIVLALLLPGGAKKLRGVKMHKAITLTGAKTAGGP
jgi:hypothetical protein